MASSKKIFFRRLKTCTLGYYLGGIVLLTGSLLQASGSQLSPDWYRLPEDGGVTERVGTPEQMRFTLGQSRMVDRLMGASAQIVDAAQVRPPTSVTLEGTDPDKVPWHLAFIRADIALTGTGTFGFLVLGGAATASLRWQPAGSQAARPTAVAPSPVPTVLHLSDSSPDEVHAQLEPFIRAVATSGKVRDPELFRTSLYAAADRFLKYSTSVADAQGDSWQVSGFRMELDVDITGMVGPALSVGGQFAIRFEWEKMQCTAVTPSRGDVPYPQLFKLVQGIADDLHVVSEADFSDTNFTPHAMNIGIGVVANGTFGVVTGSADLIGTVLYTNGVSASPGRYGESRDGGTIPILARSPSAAHLHYADTQAIPYELVGGSGRGPLDGIFNVARDRFRRGLRRAASMGKAMADRATRVHSSRWDIFELAMDYQLSIGGLFGLIQIGGLVNAEIDYAYHKPAAALRDDPGFVPTAKAQTIPELRQALETELGVWNAALTPPGPPSAMPATTTSWDLEQILLMINPVIGFGASSTQFQVIPQFGLLFKREAPKNCTPVSP